MKDLYYLIIFCFLLSCSPKLRFNWIQDGYAGQQFNKIAVVAVTKDLKARTAFEPMAVQRLAKYEIIAVEGIEVFPPSLSVDDEKPENLIRRIKDNDIDAVIIMILIDSKKR